MRAALGMLFAVTLVGAVLSSHQHKPFELRIDGAADAKPATWPKNAALDAGEAMMCRPMVITVGPRQPQPIVRT